MSTLKKYLFLTETQYKKLNYSLCRTDRTSSSSFRACWMLSNTWARGSSSVCFFTSTFLSDSLRYACCNFLPRSPCSTMSCSRYLWTDSLLYKSPISLWQRRFGAPVPLCCPPYFRLGCSVLHPPPPLLPLLLWTTRRHSPNQRLTSIWLHLKSN